MTPKALAEALNGIEYSATMHLHGSDLMKLAKGAGLVVAYGFSDDLLEFDGALYDEFGCYDGGTALIDADGLLPEFESASEDEDACRRYFERKPKARAIEAIWDGNADGYAWTLKTDIPHEVFAIMEDGAAFSRGIVFALSDLEKTGQEDT
jgi:hypothetical protein